MIKPKKWTRKTPCPHCGISGGSRHNKFCVIAYKAIGKMKNADVKPAPLLFFNTLEAYRQELCDEINADPSVYGNKRCQAIDRVISAIDNLLQAMEDLEIKE